MNLDELKGKQITYIGNVTSPSTGAKTIVITTKEHRAIISDEPECCDRRYISTDDNLSDFIGAIFYGARVMESGEVPNRTPYLEYQRLKATFFHIYTSKGAIVFKSYIEHNGNYGMLNLSAQVFER